MNLLHSSFRRILHDLWNLADLDDITSGNQSVEDQEKEPEVSDSKFMSQTHMFKEIRETTCSQVTCVES